MQSQYLITNFGKSHWFPTGFLLNIPCLNCFILVVDRFEDALLDRLHPDPHFLTDACSSCSFECTLLSLRLKIHPLHDENWRMGISLFPYHACPHRHSRGCTMLFSSNRILSFLIFLIVSHHRVHDFFIRRTMTATQFATNCMSYIRF